MLKMDVKFEVEVQLIDAIVHELEDAIESKIETKILELNLDQVTDLIFKSSSSNSIKLDDNRKIYFTTNVNKTREIIILQCKDEEINYIILNPKDFLNSLEQDYLEFYMQMKLSNLLKFDTEAAMEFQVK